jgi:hypothetical protein
MGEWEPLGDRAPVDVRRLATQLRRMKDRSGLTLAGLAERTAQSTEAWESYLAARSVPPHFAVKALAQASGADHERATALWKAARRARRGRGKPLPLPDPLDPLTAEEGLPARSGRFAAFAALGALAVAAFLTVLLTASPGTTRTPPPGAVPSAPAAPAPRPTSSLPSGTPRSLPADAAPSAPLSPPPASASPRTPPARPPSTPPRSTPPPTPSSPPPPTSPTLSPPPTPTSTPLCLDVILLNVCVGG